MDFINLRVKIIWIWSKLGENKFFSFQAKSLDDICFNNQIILKKNQILKLKFQPKSIEDIKSFKDIFFKTDLEAKVQPEFNIVDCDGFTCKQFTAISLKCDSLME